MKYFPKFQIGNKFLNLETLLNKKAIKGTVLYLNPLSSYTYMQYTFGAAVIKLLIDLFTRHKIAVRLRKY